MSTTTTLIFPATRSPLDGICCCGVFAKQDGEYRAFRTEEGGYINGPYGYLRVFRTVDALIEGIQAIK